VETPNKDCYFLLIFRVFTRDTIEVICDGQKLFSIDQHGRRMMFRFEADCDRIRLGGVIFLSFDNPFELTFIDSRDKHQLIGWQIQCSSVFVENYKDYFELPPVFGEHHDILLESAKQPKLQKFDWRVVTIERGEGFE
jgi:hypothetical protein